MRAAAGAGLVGVSLTDHDTVDGNDEAAAEAARLGLDFMVGAELSANAPGKSIHILAYGFDPTDRGLRNFFRDFLADRIRRTEKMVSRLHSLGLGITVDEVMSEAGPGVPTRAHLARALVAGEWVADINEAFHRFIARGRPAFVEKRPSAPREVNELVHRAGGVAILAHPGRDFTTAELADWIQAGFDGFEILHPRNGSGVRRTLENLVREHGLLRGGGSDWHGTDSGAPPGSQKVPVAWMHEIARRAPGAA